MFFATGLLGPPPAISSERATEGVLESTFTFVSTGLLDRRPSSTEGGALETESTLSEADGVFLTCLYIFLLNNAIGSEKCQLSSFTFVDKGLLCNLSTSVCNYQCGHISHEADFSLANSISSTSASSLHELDGVQGSSIRRRLGSYYLQTASCLYKKKLSTFSLRHP